MSWSGRLEQLLGWSNDDARGDAADVGPAFHEVIRTDDSLADVVQSLTDGPFEESEWVRRSRVPRIRPVLVVLAARSMGAEEVDKDLQYAAELLYLTLQLHDLTLGQRGGRRRKLVRRLVKRSVGFLGANQLTLRAMELVRHTGSGDLLGELVDTLREFSDAQTVATELLEESTPSVALWQEHADGHTGALFSFCCRAGAMFAGASPRDVGTLGRYGRHIGRLWHIAEDVALLHADDADEQLLSRALMGRPMLPVAAAIEAQPGLAACWRELVEVGEPRLAAVFVDRILSGGALVHAREVALKEAWTARRLVRTLDRSAHSKTLDGLAGRLATAPFKR